MKTFAPKVKPTRIPWILPYKATPFCPSVQIQEIQDQIGKINSALEERQGVINDQIRELNVIRQQKIDLDKQIQLQTSQITDLNRHIERYESDIERLTEDKE